MKYTLAILAIAITYIGQTFGAVMQVGQFQTISGTQHENVNITWSLEGSSFKVINQGSDAVITQINFETDRAMKIASIYTTPDFHINLKNLPQGNSIGFTSDYGFTAKPSPINNGVDVGEYEKFGYIYRSSLSSRSTCAIYR